MISKSICLLVTLICQLFDWSRWKLVGQFDTFKNKTFHLETIVHCPFTKRFHHTLIIAMVNEIECFCFRHILKRIGQLHCISYYAFWQFVAIFRSGAPLWITLSVSKSIFFENLFILQHIHLQMYLKYITFFYSKNLKQLI